MKRFDVEAAYLFANKNFPDDGDLGLFNLVIEVMNGDLPYEVIEGPEDVVAHPDADIAATLAMGTVGPYPCRLDWVFAEDWADQKPKLRSLVRTLTYEAGAKELISFKRPPFTIAALVACRGADGRYAYAIFRNPAFDETQARNILVSSFPSDEEEPAAPDGSPKN